MTTVPSFAVVLSALLLGLGLRVPTCPAVGEGHRLPSRSSRPMASGWPA